MKYKVSHTWSGKINVSIANDDYKFGKEELNMAATAPSLHEIPKELEGLGPHQILVHKHPETGQYMFAQKTCRVDFGINLE